MPQLASPNDELDLGEFFALILHRWWFICLVSLTGMILAGFYAFSVADAEYQASTRFEIFSSSQNSLAIGQGTALSALAGINLSPRGSEADALKDRILARPFVGSIYEKAGFSSDPIFNSSLKDPNLIERLKTFIVGSSLPRELDRDDYLVMAVRGLTAHMQILQSENGIIELRVTHPNGERAAHVANIVVEQALLDIFEREQSQKRASLKYYANELLEARANLDAASTAVRDYAITNSLRSSEDLARTSTQLSQVRLDIETIDLSISALENISKKDFVGAKFARDYPVSTSLSFRRLLNLSVSPSTWVRPTDDQIDSGIRQLEEQRASLTSSFNSLKARAKRFGDAALELSILQREVEVQQAIYESMIAQFQESSLLSGYELASSRVVESAIPPAGPSSPNKVFMAAMGAILGFIISIGYVLASNFRHGYLYTHAKIKSAFGSFYTLQRERAQVGKINNSELNTRQLAAARELFLTIEDPKTSIAFMPSGDHPGVERIALDLSKASSLFCSTMAIVDMSNSSLSRLVQKSQITDIRSFSCSNLMEGVELLLPKDSSQFLVAERLEKELNELKANYERIFFVLPNPAAGTAISLAVTRVVDATVVIAQRKTTTRFSVEKIKSIIEKSRTVTPVLVII
ncbi:GNVR domain-containing protein [Cognatishimia sp. SS12]|uniref:GumC family protein n=1 Tax=Cognatishimia sp. SS12 TaxID=2979465 RepID=UPI00232AD45E|nr:GNVR domain-containing protein [Cognatishimia sp. SS12]MDC0739705.1 GNVR domain-containing protein [Cognatishimia sp. SS12]